MTLTFEVCLVVRIKELMVLPSGLIMLRVYRSDQVIDIVRRQLRIWLPIFRMVQVNLTLLLLLKYSSCQSYNRLQL